MTKLVYRTVAHDSDQKKAETRVYRRPELVYRGVEHNGVRPTKQTSGSNMSDLLVYRGYRAT